MRGAIVSALADNEIGRLVEDLILTGGVDTTFIQWVPYDGTGRSVRNGQNLTERGFGVRGAVGVSDRGHTAVSQLKPGDVDWDLLFGELGVRWLHTGGIFAALSESAANIVLEAVTAAKTHGTVVSYDLNYRPSRWQAIGGIAKAQQVNQAIAPFIDVKIGNEEDFTASLGFAVEGVDENLSTLGVAKFVAMITAAAYPNFAVIATTMRSVRSASINDWGAIAWAKIHFSAGGTVWGGRRGGCPVPCRTGQPVSRVRREAAQGQRTSSSIQSKVLVTAFFQSRYWRSRSPESMFGTQRLSSAQLSMTSCSPDQNPTAMPAA